MERLTKKYGDYEYGIKPLDNECKVCASCLKCEEHLNRITQKLGEYEAIGLEPREVKDVLKSAIDKTPCNVSFDIGTDMYNIALEKSLQNVFGMTTDEVTQIIDNYKNGKLVDLPCKVGDKIFVIPSKVNFKLNILHNHSENNRVYTQFVNEIRFLKNGSYILETCDHLCSAYSEFYKINWFFTHKEAEEALKERDN